MLLLLASMLALTTVARRVASTTGVDVATAVAVQPTNRRGGGADRRCRARAAGVDRAPARCVMLGDRAASSRCRAATPVWSHPWWRWRCYLQHPPAVDAFAVWLVTATGPSARGAGDAGDPAGLAPCLTSGRGPGWTGAQRQRIGSGRGVRWPWGRVWLRARASRSTRWCRARRPPVHHVITMGIVGLLALALARRRPALAERERGLVGLVC